MKQIIASTAIALGFSVSAFAAEPATDHSQHQQQAKPAESRQTQPSTAHPAPQGHMQHHRGMGQGMKMEGCCCCKKDAQSQMSCDDKAAASAAEAQDHSKH